MQVQHLFNINITQNNTLYLEKNEIQDPYSNFLSFDKRVQKKVAFFYYQLIKVQNLKKKHKAKFFIKKSVTKDNFIYLEKKENFFLRNKALKSCKMYSINSTCKYTSSITLGITTHLDAYKTYKKEKSL